MTSVSATTATNTTPATSTTSTSPTAATPKKSFDALFAEAKDDLKKGEKLSKVDGHQFARIKGGERDEMCVNLSGNARSGQAFDLIWREGRQFHVYGSGKDRHVVEVGHKAASTTTDKTASSTTTGATTDSPASGTTTGTTTDSTASTTTGTTGTSKTTNTSAASTGGATAASA